MKKIIIALTVLLTMAANADAMSYEQARREALFLTDKMAYELNLTEDQYEAAYEINLDYLLSIKHRDDLYGIYWTRRNLDLEYILLDWQYRTYRSAVYFYRPLYWDTGYWHFGIYARYPQRTYFYYGYPDFWYSYRGRHSWRHNGGRSWYRGREWGYSHRYGRGGRGFGMRDGFDRGDYRNRRPEGYSGRGRTYEGHGRRGDFGRRRDDGYSRGDMDRRHDWNNRGDFSNGRRREEFTTKRKFDDFTNRRRSDDGSYRESSTRSTASKRGEFDRPNNDRGMQGRPSGTFSPSRSSGSFDRPRQGSSQSSGSFSRPSNSGGSNRSFGNGPRGGGGHFGGRR
ncbi:hypothetical protein [Prevotella sp. OH937_COT-195]|uniref:hypothetical protein n=1 Tax=Prevotella sp. OH937_COT-195 TaxID=2491051 RepID=UPI000F64C9FB|nr:hypothetical protein [Prevotella sp. OH937_COT-195]RRD02744.1 hypothetical protein EII32_01665 [Prevotella sp. OH937_COT-195]